VDYLRFFGLGLALIVVVLNDPLSALTREPVPYVSHVLLLLFLLRVFHLSRHLTALNGLPLVFRDFLHGGPPTVLKVISQRRTGKYEQTKN
jgi:hypothetical protein